MIKADYKHNKLLATNKNNAQHNEIKTRMVVAAKTNALHLNQLNLDSIIPDVFKMTNLIRLDLSFNNLVRISPRISELKNLQQLWLNDNPLREVPVEISQCLKLREMDLKNTFIITLPRELANLTSLLILNMDNCPMKESLNQTYQGGMVSMHTELRRKEDRKIYKEKLFDTLTEWIYPSQPKEEVFEKIELIFLNLKDCNTEMLKKMHRNVQMLFPVKFDDIDPNLIREKLFKLYDEGIAREDIGQIVLRLKSHFLDEPLEDVYNLATDMFKNIQDQNTIDSFFRYKSHIFLEPLGKLNAGKLIQNLENYKEFKRQERIEMIQKLKQGIDQLYADEKIKEERLNEYTEGLVKELRRTNLIVEFTRVLRKPKSLITINRRFYERMSTEEYLINSRKAFTNQQIQKASLKPLLEASINFPFKLIDHGSDCRTILFSLPTIPIEKRLDLFLEGCGQYQPDVIFLQLDPMHYITRQRFMSQKCALHDVEDYDKKAIDDLNFPFPMTWEEAVVNLLTFDMLRANQIHMKLDYTKGVSTYAYPDLQNERVHDNLRDKFVQAITDYIICDNWSPYYEINQILYKALMGKHKVVLGDMPEILLRQILGNSLSLEDVKDIFKFVLEQISKAKVPVTMQTASLQYFSHIFLMPKDLYMTALLRNVMQAANCALVYVGHPHFVPIQNYWVPPPHGINFSQATKIPKRLENETNEMLIEKQAIIEVLLDSRLWGEKYIVNPFPYIEKDITKISEQDLKAFKKHFYISLKKYQAFRDRIVAPEAYQMIEELDKKYERLGDVKMIPKV